MKPTEILIEEHRVIERVLFALEKAARRLNHGEDVYLRFFIGTSVFIRDFADNCHHKKEENVLFPAMVHNGLNGDSDKLEVILAEHDEGRRLTQKIRQTTERLQAGDMHARELVTQFGTEFVTLLRKHMNYEEKILFPLADKIIPVEQYEQIINAFARFQTVDRDEEFREKYYGLANRLVQECLR